MVMAIFSFISVFCIDVDVYIGLEYSMTIFTQCTLFYMAQHDIQSFDLVPACNQPHATLLRRILLVRFTMMYSYPGVLKLYISLLYKILIYRVIHSANPALFHLHLNKIIPYLSLVQRPA